MREGLAVESIWTCVKSVEGGFAAQKNALQ
jgi:hypothetical protein